MKLKRKLMSRIIEDLESRGAKVMVIVEPDIKGGDGPYKLNWVIDAKWPTGRHWQINTIIEEV